MRPVICGLAAFAFAQPALAADYSDYMDMPSLRGSEVYELATPSHFRWSGAYIGGQVGYSSANMDFSEATGPLVAFILRESALENTGQVSQWDLLGRAHASSMSYGGFIGYNSQWDDVVLGIEANYNRAKLFGSVSDSLSRGVSPGDGFSYYTTVDGSASYKITDFGTLRGRAGYVMGRFLPYAFIGLAVGRVESTASATVTAIITDPQGVLPPSTYGPITRSDTGPKTAYGYSAGLGIDVSLAPNVFLRGEYEYIRFDNNLNISLSTARTALGLKF